MEVGQVTRDAASFVHSRALASTYPTLEALKQQKMLELMVQREETIMSGNTTQHEKG
ncbi:MAG: hypothetical protein NVS9B9_29320 [Ktedonobacteraceae bacterium]